MECDYQGSTKETLKRYKEQKQLGIRYKCDECDCIVSSSQMLKLTPEKKASGCSTDQVKSQEKLKSHDQKTDRGRKFGGKTCD